jgi:hypothetical protein
MRGVRVQKVILGQEAREQQSVPVFVGDVLQQVVNLLRARPLVADIAERSTAGAQPVAELARLDCHVRSVVLLVHGQVLERRPHATLRCLSSSESHPGQLVAKVLGKDVSHDRS